MLTYLSTVLSARSRRRDERGASAVEYALLVAGIVASMVISTFALGHAVTDSFNASCKAVSQTTTCN